MTQRLYNFSAGPATMPLPVLERSSAHLVDFQGAGVGIAEVSHRGKEFNAVREEAEARCRELMGIGDDYAVLFLQGGATLQFELLAMNFLQTRADYVDSGQWASKAAQAGARHGTARVVASSKASNYDRLPAVTPDPESDYLHICSNNTIYGTRFATFPEHPCLIADMSSEIMSREIDVSRFGMIYAGAQKNLGPAGVVLVIVRRALLARIPDDLAPIFHYGKHAAADSCLNTPPTFGITVLCETFRWLAEQGGLAGIEAANAGKAEALYAAIDGSDGFYAGTVQEVADRSHMNVTFTLRDDAHTADFLAGAAERGMVALKGYRTVGGVRASIYNAMPRAGVDALVAYMDAFRRERA